MAQEPDVSALTVSPSAARAFTTSGSAKNSAFSEPITPRTVFVAVLLSSLSRPAATATATPPISSTARTIPTMRLTREACSRKPTFQAELGGRKVKR